MHISWDDVQNFVYSVDSQNREKCKSAARIWHEFATERRSTRDVLSCFICCYLKILSVLFIYIYVFETATRRKIRSIANVTSFASNFQRIIVILLRSFRFVVNFLYLPEKSPRDPIFDKQPMRKKFINNR